MAELGGLTATFHGWTLPLLAIIYTVSAAFSGLSGFGFSAIGALTLCLVPPQFGVCMLMLLSVFTQAMSLRALKEELRTQNDGWQKGFLPYAAGGVVGLPLGLKILAYAPTRGLILGLGFFLVAYSIYSIFKPRSLALPARETSLGGAFAVGAVGGIVGGFSAFPGSALVVWNGLKEVSKERGRALTQPFILVMQLVALALVAYSRPAVFDSHLVTTLLMAMPLAWFGTRLGLKIYRHASQLNYRFITLAALGVSGLSLVLKGILLSTS